MGVTIRSLKARVEADLDLTRALGVSERPQVQRIDWQLDVDAEASADVLEELGGKADAHCPRA